MDFDDDIFNQELDVSWQEQCAALQSRLNEYKTYCKLQSQDIADLSHENNTLKNNINAYSTRHGVKFRNADRYQWLRKQNAMIDKIMQDSAMAQKQSNSQDIENAFIFRDMTKKEDIFAEMDYFIGQWCKNDANKMKLFDWCIALGCHIPDDLLGFFNALKDKSL